MESESECAAGPSAKRIRVESATGVSGENQQVPPRYIQCVYVCVCGGGGGGGFIPSSLIDSSPERGKGKRA